MCDLLRSPMAWESDESFTALKGQTYAHDFKSKLITVGRLISRRWLPLQFDCKDRRPAPCNRRHGMGGRIVTVPDVPQIGGRLG